MHHHPTKLIQGARGFLALLLAGLLGLSAGAELACGGDDTGSDPECGNGVVEEGEACDDGDANSDTEPDACRTSCVPAGCGDGAADSAEECDGEDLRGTTCESEGFVGGSVSCDASCAVVLDECVALECGNGVAQPDNDEECDGDDLAGVSCQSFGFPSGTLVCGASCLVDLSGCVAVCGDGMISGDETCDDGNTEPGDGCSGACEVEAGWTCDGAPSVCQAAACGDGLQVADEECDDGNLLSHDGCSSGCTLEELRWTELPTATAPPRRFGHTLAYDEARDRLLLFGGWAEGALSETWEHDGAAWSLISPSTSPPARYHHAAAYSGLADAVVLTGGRASGVTGIGDTWTYMGGSWMQLAQLSARYYHGMAFDSLRGVMVAYGGTNGGAVIGETWELIGVWTAAAPALSPPARFGHQMAFDSIRGVVVLFGGFDGATEFADTWEYAGATWVQAAPTVSPPHRRFGAMAYDAFRGRIVLFGGSDGVVELSDTWEYDGTTWVQTPTLVAPESGPMAYDSLRRRIVLSDSSATSATNKTWIYQLGSDWPDEICDSGQDDDGDGLVDCADPDCEGLSCANGTCAGGVCQ